MNEIEDKYKRLISKIKEVYRDFCEASTNVFESEFDEAVTYLETVAGLVKRERLLRQAFQRYLPERVVEKLLSCPDDPQVEGERRTVTVLFADISGFTPLAEKLDAEEVMKIVNTYFSKMSDIIAKYGGTVDKFLGDALMVLFGAPIAHENDPERAVRAGLEMLQAMNDFKIDQWGVSLNMSIGINTGNVVAGDVGSQLRREYTVIGDAVNLAARIEGMAEKGKLLIGEKTYEKIKHKFQCIPIHSVLLKGKSEPVTVYQVLDVWHHPAVSEDDRWVKSVALVGREAELEVLKTCFKKVKKGQGQFVRIVAEAGVGKTRLMEEASDFFNQNNALTLWGECVSYGEFTSFLPFVKIVKELFGITEADGGQNLEKKFTSTCEKLEITGSGELTAILDLLSPQAAGQRETLSNPEENKRKICRAMEKLLLEVSKRKPLVLVFEDVHWIDRASWELLQHLVQQIEQVAVMVCCLYRPDFEGTFPTNHFCHEIRLKKLSRRESAVLIQSLLKSKTKIPAKIQDLILSKSEGNPFYVEEVIKSLIELAVIKKKNGEWEFQEDLSRVQIPDTIQGIVMARIDRLDENVKRTLQMASVLGRTFPFRLLQAICRSTDDVLHQLSELGKFDLLLKRRHSLEDEYMFKHIMTQEVAYQSLLIERRKSLHERVGRAIETLYPTRIDEFCEALAHHFCHSDDTNKAVFYLNKAGRKNYNLGEREVALQQYQLSLELTEKSGNARAKAESLQQIGNIERERNNWNLAMSYYQQALEIFQQLGDLNGVAGIYNNMGIIYYEQANWPRVTEYYEKALEIATQNNNWDFMGSIFNNLGIVCSIQGELNKAIDYYSRSIACYEKAGNKLSINRPYCNLAMTYVDQQNWEEANRCYAKALSISEELGDISTMAYIYLNMVEIYLSLSQLEKALESCKLAKKIFRKIGDNLGIADVYKFLGKIFALKGQWVTSEKYFRRSIRLNKQFNCELGLAETYYELGLMLSQKGNYLNALKYMRAARKLFQGQRAKQDLKKVNRQIRQIKEKKEVRIPNPDEP